MILHARHPAPHGYAIHVYVHRGQKHRDLLPAPRRGRFPRGVACHHDAAIGWRDHRRSRSVVHAVRVSKEEQHEPGNHEQRQPEDGAGQKPDESGSNGRPKNEGPTRRIDSHKGIRLWSDRQTQKPGLICALAPETKPGFPGEVRRL